MHIGDMLCEAGILTKEQLDSALDYQKQIGGHLGHIMVKLGYITENKLISFLSKQMQIPTYDLDGFVPDPEILKTIPAEVIDRLNIVPIKKEMGTLVIGGSNPTDFAAMDELRMHAKGNVDLLLVAPSKARDIINEYVLREGKGEAAPGGKQRQHRRGREGLSNLVHQLERDADLKQSAAGSLSPTDSAFSEVRTRDLILALISALESKGIVSKGSLISEIKKLDANASGENQK
ncbi:MAG: hypothetical protein JXR97_05185 [Planctomycetes bacterium]|nr:hypothetical protein [Planctomycetota bacterium]